MVRFGRFVAVAVMAQISTSLCEKPTVAGEKTRYKNLSSKLMRRFALKKKCGFVVSEGSLPEFEEPRRDKGQGTQNPIKAHQHDTCADTRFILHVIVLPNETMWFCTTTLLP